MKLSEFRPLSVSPSRLTRTDHLFIIGFTIISFFLRSRFIVTGFGEVDAAKFGIHAYEWYAFGAPEHLSYLFRTSILYLHFLRTALEWGFPAAHLDALMNWTSLAAGSLAGVPLFYFWRRFASTGTCILFLTVLFFMPAFWLGHIYGMPHIPGLLFLFIALLCFDRFVCEASRRRVAYAIIAGLCAVLTLGLKADLLLCFGVFPALAVIRSRRLFRDLLTAVLIPVLALALVLCYQTVLFSVLSDTIEFSQEWEERFPFTLQALGNVENIASSVFTLGLVMSAAVTAALGYGVVRKKRFDILFLVLCWSLPLAAFWGLKMGNSARHMLAAFLPLLFYAVLMLQEAVPRFLPRLAAAGVLVLLNYFICPGGQLPRTVRPSSRIFEAAAHIQNHVARWHALGREFAADPSRPKLIAGNDFICYPKWESLILPPDPASDGTLSASEKPAIKALFREAVDRDEIRTLYPDWTIWIWIARAGNTGFELEKLSPLSQ